MILEKLLDFTFNDLSLLGIIILESFLDLMKNLTYYHAANCTSYNSILKKIYNFKNERLFKIRNWREKFQK